MVDTSGVQTLQNPFAQNTLCCVNTVGKKSRFGDDSHKRITLNVLRNKVCLLLFRLNILAILERSARV
jgi:hypothetical protein